MTIALDSPHFPAQWKQTAEGARDALELLRNEQELDWTMLSPSALLEHGVRTGKFRLVRDSLWAIEQQEHSTMSRYLDAVSGPNAEQVGKLVLRLALGVLILFHGVAKLTGGIDFISDVVVKAGLPSFLAYGVYFGEVVAAALVIAGWYSRAGAALIAVNMLFAIGLVHAGEIFAIGQSGGWALELQGMFLFSAIAVALLGPGKFSVNSR